MTMRTQFGVLQSRSWCSHLSGMYVACVSERRKATVCTGSLRFHLFCPSPWDLPGARPPSSGSSYFFLRDSRGVDTKSGTSTGCRGHGPELIFLPSSFLPSPFLSFSLSPAPSPFLKSELEREKDRQRSFIHWFTP